jgi:glycerol-3-phosphate dehydrogenase (NAD(P)+)
MTTVTRPVGVVGGGTFGTTLAHLAGQQGHEALLWMRDTAQARALNETRIHERYLPGLRLSDRIRATDDLAEVVGRCHLLLVAIPSEGFRSVARALGDHVRGDQVVVSATKGLERGTYGRMTEILRQETCARKLGALSGPNLALDLVRGVPAGTVIASAYDEVVRAVERVLHGAPFRVYASRDVLGVELGGAMKNVIAIAGGLARGLGFGDSTLALLVTRGLAEMARLGAVLGADPRTFTGLSGAGDLMVTAWSELSRNHRVGRRLAAGEPLDTILGNLGQVAEGVPTARVVHEWCTGHGLTLPICEGVYRILYEGAAPRSVVEEIVRLPALWELEGRPIV